MVGEETEGDSGILSEFEHDRQPAILIGRSSWFKLIEGVQKVEAGSYS